jgi:hypothetical protein
VRKDRTAGVREARLLREYADFYPTLPVRFWTAAAKLSTIILSEIVGTQEHQQGTSSGRLLPDERFEFRGGCPRGPSPGLRTRAGDMPQAGPGGASARERDGEPPTLVIAEQPSKRRNDRASAELRERRAPSSPARRRRPSTSSGDRSSPEAAAPHYGDVASDHARSGLK